MFTTMIISIIIFCIVVSLSHLVILTEKAGNGLTHKIKKIVKEDKQEA